MFKNETLINDVLNNVNEIPADVEISDDAVAELRENAFVLVPTEYMYQNDADNFPDGNKHMIQIDERWIESYIPDVEKDMKADPMRFGAFRRSVLETISATAKVVFEEGFKGDGRRSSAAMDTLVTDMVIAEAIKRVFKKYEGNKDYAFYLFGVLNTETGEEDVMTVCAKKTWFKKQERKGFTFK